MSRVNFTGEQVGPYFVRKRIGQGGMAAVYRAYQPSVKREVALKVISLLPGAEYGEFRKRFDQEAETIASLEHPHILPIFEYGVTNELVYIAMRLLRGGTIRDLLDQGYISIERTADIFGQIARALGYAHRKGVVHRDLKPSNILLDNEGNAYLTDFGLAKLMSRSSQLTATGSIIGTPAYMAPEQLRGDPIDYHADIYSLGVILYHMTTGRPPFEALTTFSLIYQQVEKTPPTPREFNPEIPEAVESVILRALQKNPDARFQSAEQMANTLDVALERKVSAEQDILAASSPEAVTLHPPSSITPRTPTPGQSTPVTIQISRPRPKTLGVTAIVALVVFAVIFLLVQIGNAPLTFSPPTVLTGERSISADVIPSEEEITLARQRLGNEGFVAYVTCNQSSEYHATLTREMSDFATEHDIPFEVYDSDNDAYDQLTLIEQARTDGAQALVICVLDHELLTDVLTAAQENNIPLVLLTGAPPAYGGVLITSDDYQLGLVPGCLAGQIVADEMDGIADVVILGYPDLPHLVARANGLEDGLLEFAPEANIVAHVTGGTRESAEESIRELIEDGVHFDVILSINDAGSLGAVEALEDADFEPDTVVIVSVDAEAQARQFIREGRFIRGSVPVSSTAPAHASINAAIKLLTGGTLPETILTPPGEIITREETE